MDSGGEHEAPAQPQANGSGGRKKKLMYRHTPQQIQELEAYAFCFPLSLLLRLLLPPPLFLSSPIFDSDGTAQDVQGVPAPRRQAAGEDEQGLGARVAPDQVLVPEQEDLDEGK
ncbi:hypothetical protein ZIOFF_063040 [Zingiber officinale]|uniref:Uncharacterized protein n=1 Tax=Zingiber officinale TaxID=94328 RepID=A0A8J5F674_ZINOF|nr:hypothetical protein ZIOFF_063040 [Zingiber officinale]